MQELALNLEHHALRDFVQRAKRGIFLHAPMWLLMGLCVRLDVSDPRVFWFNLAGFALATALRSWFIGYSSALMDRNLKLAVNILRSLVFAPCLHWSVLAVLATQDGHLHALMLPLLLVVVGLATAGTVVLSIDTIVRIWFPIVALIPVGIGFLVHQPSPMGALLAVMDILVIFYVLTSTRVVHSDYWTALQARALLEQRTLNLESLSTTDALTQIPNRLFLERSLEQAWAQAIQNRRPLSLLLVDLDHFKEINDTHGHSVGDECLRAAAQAMVRGMLRDSDRVARWGGEEFMVLLPNTDLASAQIVAQRLLNGVASTVIPCPAGLVRLACSIGVATLNPEAPRLNWKSLIDDADRALYEAKSQGRNRVVATAA